MRGEPPQRQGCGPLALIVIVAVVILGWAVIGGLLYELWHYVNAQILPYLTPARSLRGQTP